MSFYGVQKLWTGQRRADEVGVVGSQGEVGIYVAQVMVPSR